MTKICQLCFPDECYPKYGMAKHYHERNTMTWQIAVGFFTISSALISVVTVAVKVNRAIVLLEAAVKRLDEHAASQEKLNERIDKQLHGIDRRLILLENYRRVGGQLGFDAKSDISQML